MKKSIGFLIVLAGLSNCLLFDTINLTWPWNGVIKGDEAKDQIFTFGVIKGDEAKDQIFTSALIGAAVDPDNNDDIIAILSPQLTGINDDRYYLKSDIDTCANDALILNLLILDIGGFTCNARERKVIVDPIL